MPRGRPWGKPPLPFVFRRNAAIAVWISCATPAPPCATAKRENLTKSRSTFADWTAAIWKPRRSYGRRFTAAECPEAGSARDAPIAWRPEFYHAHKWIPHKTRGFSRALCGVFTTFTPERTYFAEERRAAFAFWICFYIKITFILNCHMLKHLFNDIYIFTIGYYLLRQMMSLPKTDGISHCGAHVKCFSVVCCRKKSVQSSFLYWFPRAEVLYCIQLYTIKKGSLWK